MRERLLVHLRSLPQIVEGWNRSEDTDLQPSQFARSLTKVKNQCFIYCVLVLKIEVSLGPRWCEIVKGYNCICIIPSDVYSLKIIIEWTTRAGFLEFQYKVNNSVTTYTQARCACFVFVLIVSLQFTAGFLYLSPLPDMLLNYISALGLWFLLKQSYFFIKWFSLPSEMVRFDLLHLLLLEYFFWFLGVSRTYSNEGWKRPQGRNIW